MLMQCLLLALSGYAHPLADLCLFYGPGEREKVILLKNSDSKKDVEHFRMSLMEHGLEMEDFDFDRRFGRIRAARLTLTHPEGLQWEISATGFDQWEIRLLVEPDGEIVRLTYRFDKQPISRPFITSSWAELHFHSKKTDVTEIFHVYH